MDKRIMKHVTLSLVMAVVAVVAARSEVDPAAVAQRVREDAAPRKFLERLSDDFGGRLTGSAASVGARARLISELKKLGLEPQTETFSMPGWERGDDSAEMLAPFARPLRVAALAYTQPAERFEAEVVHLGRGRPEDYPKKSVKGMIGLVDASANLRGDRLGELAVEHGLRGLLYTNREGGGQLLARSSSFQGDAMPVPFFCITQEEGQWIARLLARGETVRIAMESQSRPRPVEGVNVSVTFPGAEPSTVLVGAHFDSWDLGQGALDNGIGVAQLFALARALRDTQLRHTVKLVWFDGEEQGLWGSRIHAAATRDEPLVAMVNLDMVGVPIGVNALGADGLVPALERWEKTLPENTLPKGVENLNWLGSDHTPFQLAGVPSITFNAPIHRESVRYYHDLADTIDKVYPGLIEDASAVIASLVVTLAEDPQLSARRLSKARVREMFTRFNLKERLLATGLELP